MLTDIYVCKSLYSCTNIYNWLELSKGIYTKCKTCWYFIYFYIRLNPYGKKCFVKYIGVKSKHQEKRRTSELLLRAATANNKNNFGVPPPKPVRRPGKNLMKTNRRNENEQTGYKKTRIIPV